MKKRVIITALALLPLLSSAQKWDIEKCIDYAIHNNIQIKQATTSVEVSRLNREQAKFNYLPSLNASAGYNASFGRSLDQTTYQYIDNKTVNGVNGSIGINTQLFAGMNKLYSLRKSEINLLAAVQDVELIKNSITMSITAAYLQILYGKEQLTNSRNQIELLTQQIERTQKLVDAGSVALGAQLELEAQAATERYNLVTYENNLSNAMLTLTQMLELRNAPDFDIEIPDVSKIVESPISVSVNEVNEKAQQLPQITASELRTKASEYDVKLARARYYPTLSFNASYGSSFSDARQRPQFAPDGTTIYGKYPFFDQFADNASSQLSLSMQIPIFNGLTTRRNVSIANRNLQNSNYSFQLEKDKLYKEIQQAYTDASGALNRYVSAKSSVRSSEESFRYAEQKFSAGATTSVDYTTAKNNLLTAQSMRLQAKYEYVLRIKLLNFYKGEPITL